MPTQRARLRQFVNRRRHARQVTNSVQLTHRRPVGRSFARVTALGCDLEFLAGFDSERPWAPGSAVTSLQAWDASSLAILGPQPYGFTGGTAFGFGSELFTVTNPAVVSSVPSFLLVGSTTVGAFLIGSGFRETPVDTFVVVLPESTEEDVMPDPLASVSNVTFVADPVAEGLVLAEGFDAVKCDIVVDAAHQSAVLESTYPAAILSYSVVRS